MKDKILTGRTGRLVTGKGKTQNVEKINNGINLDNHLLCKHANLVTHKE